MQGKGLLQKLYQSPEFLQKRRHHKGDTCEETAVLAYFEGRPTGGGKGLDSSSIGK